MKLFRKEGETVEILCFPREEVSKGDYLLVEDTRSKKSLLAQVIDIQFINFPGLVEELVREEITEINVFGDDFDPLNLESQITLLKDVRILICKIRCSIINEVISLDTSWLPSRIYSKIYRVNFNELFKLLGIGLKRPIKIGFTRDGSELKVDADALDGGLSIIIGRKGTGKSHLCKLLMLGLVEYGAPCLVFDVNGEYTGLGLYNNGEKNRYYSKIFVLEPGRNFKVTLEYAGKTVLSNILLHVLGLTELSLRELFRVWDEVKKTKNLTFRNILETLRFSTINDRVKEAIISRLYTLEHSHLFTDNPHELLRLEDVLTKISNGGIIILNLSKVSTLERKIVVEFVLGKLIELLKAWLVKAIFLFAEEAHLYLSETYWDDIITRMRHLGIFTFFITNQPASIHEDIYRQVDSVFLFNFKNENDLNMVSKVAKIDSETMKSIACSLEPHYCLIIGQVTKEVPLIVKVKELNVKTMGETRNFFN